MAISVTPRLSKPFPLGAALHKSLGVSFKVWAPFASCADVILLKKNKTKSYPLTKDTEGYYSALIPAASAGDKYWYLLDKKKQRPDPAARFQPEGVHGPSQVVNPQNFKWQDSFWKGIPLRDAIFYELHIGTFTREGTFDAALQKIPYLKKLGITCVEIMPVSQFPGKRNWGYDGVGLYAVQNSYGGPEKLKRFVNACHRAGLAVCLDVVYNHFGPEGNYLNDFGPYFTKKYSTPWGDAVNYDDKESKHVRRFVIENALYWTQEYHFDALRLDAVHGIYDRSKKHLLQELNSKVQLQAKKRGKQVHVIAESDWNDSKIIRPVRSKGYGLSAQWSDDFHHAVHAFLTQETKGYYSDFGRFSEVVKAVTEGFVYDGRYSKFRKKKHGNSAADLPREKLVVCIQNHDQIGNRAWGERLSRLLSFQKLKSAAALLLLAGNTPLLFMGEEYGEKAPFQYFTDHGDENLVRAVREGRKREFASFGWKTVPDPNAEKTFLNSKLTWGQAKTKEQICLHRLYCDLISFRKKILLGGRLMKIHGNDSKGWIFFQYEDGQKNTFGAVISFLNRSQEVTFPIASDSVQEVLNTENSRYGGVRKKIKVFRGIVTLPAYSAWAGKWKREK